MAKGGKKDSNARAKQENVPYYIQIVSDLRRQIRGGRTRPGQALPTESDLMKRWNVSRITVRNALKILERDGSIYRLAGKGTFVADPQTKARALMRGIRAERRGGIKIGLLVPCVKFEVFAGIIRGAEEALARSGGALLLGNFDDRPEREQELIHEFRERGARGLLFAPSCYSDPACYRRIMRDGMPVVFLDSMPDDAAADLVLTDNLAGALMGMERLVSAGCRRPAFVCGGVKTTAIMERLAGYRLAAMEVAGALDMEKLPTGTFDEAAGYNMAADMLRRGADGLLAATSNLTPGVMQAVRDAGREAKTVVFDEFSADPGLPPPLSVIVQPGHAIGNVGVHRLLRRIAEQETGIPRAPIQKICLRPSLAAPQTAVPAGRARGAARSRSRPA